MEYIIGESTRHGNVIMQLVTSGDEHTELFGRISITTMQDKTEIRYNCTIKEHYKSADGVDGKKYDFYEVENISMVSDISQNAVEQYENNTKTLLLTIGNSANNDENIQQHSQFFDKIKAYYNEGRINDINNYVEFNLITPIEFKEITGEDYQPNANDADYERALNELGVK